MQLSPVSVSGGLGGRLYALAAVHAPHAPCGPILSCSVHLSAGVLSSALHLTHHVSRGWWWWWWRGGGEGAGLGSTGHSKWGGPVEAGQVGAVGQGSARWVGSTGCVRLSNGVQGLLGRAQGSVMRSSSGLVVPQHRGYLACIALNGVKVSLAADPIPKPCQGPCRSQGAAVLLCACCCVQNSEIIKRWVNEVQEAVQSKHSMVQFHAVALLHALRYAMCAVCADTWAGTRGCGVGGGARRAAAGSAQEAADVCSGREGAAGRAADELQHIEFLCSMMVSAASCAS
jgi:hypothetical protein